MTNTSTTPQTSELRRPIEGRIVAGVAAGLGNRFSINPWWFRIGLIVLALFGGLGLVLYAVGWLLIPEEGTDDPVVARWIAGASTSNTAMVVGAALITLALLILAVNFDLISGSLLFAAVLFVIGVLLYRGDIGGKDNPTGPDDDGGETVPEEEMVDTIQQEALEEINEEIPPPEGGGDPPEALAPAVAEPPPPPAPKQRSILGQLTIAAVLIALGGLALLDVADVLDPGFVHYVAVALGVIGGGLVVGTVFGRARWLIIPGLLLIPLLVVSSVVPGWDFGSEVGDTYYRPGEAALIAESYEQAVGSLHVDLTDLDPQTGGVVVEARVGAGRVRIDVPDDVAVVVEGSVGIGAIDLFGDERVGIGVESTAETGSPPVMTVIAEAGVGSIVVRER